MSETKQAETREWSKGAKRAAQIIEREQQTYDRASFPLKNHTVCEIISRETHDQEMAELLREAEGVFVLIAKFSSGDLTIMKRWRVKYAALLSTLEKI